MPGLDRKGPKSEGPRTGRGRGLCGKPENEKNIDENDLGVGRGGEPRGGGRGRCFGGRGGGRGGGGGQGRGGSGRGGGQGRGAGRGR